MLEEFAPLKTKHIGMHDSSRYARCRDVICHYVAYDQLLGEAIKEDYKRIFDHARQIDEKVYALIRQTRIGDSSPFWNPKVSL